MMKKTVLIVEDEKKLANILIEYLNKDGFETNHISTGSKVVPWVRKHNPNLILLDLMLPEINGKEICQEIRTFSSLPIIMVTAMVEEIDRLIGLELGADDYIYYECEAVQAVAGYAHSEAKIYDQEGRLIALSRQLVGVYEKKK